MKKYDVVIVGAGLYGAVFARICKDAGKSVLVIEKRNHIAGNAYDYKDEDIIVQKYGAHIFHTSNEEVWKFLNNYTKFVPYIHKIKAKYNDKTYTLPFNLNTFKEIYKTDDIDKVKEILRKRTINYEHPKNLKEQALKTVGKDIYKILIKGYTEKQWMKKCSQLPPTILSRIPIKFNHDDNYFTDKYQGIPKNGYTSLVKKLLKDIPVKLNMIFSNYDLTQYGHFVVYSGRIDEFFDYQFGKLEYRSVDFEILKLNSAFYQDRAVVNYTSKKEDYTRIIEHKYFLNNISDKTIITIERPIKFTKNSEAYYPINNEKNNQLYCKYLELASKISDRILFSGRLGKYKYLDMDKVVELAINEANEYLRRTK